MIYAILAVVLLACNHLDFLLQAYQWKWPTWWTLNPGGKKWGLFDFIPHDSWHVVFWLRNSTIAAGAFLAVAAVPTAWDSWAILLYIAAYAVTRWLGFTVPRKLCKGDING